MLSMRLAKSSETLLVLLSFLIEWHLKYYINISALWFWILVGLNVSIFRFLGKIHSKGSFNLLVIIDVGQKQEFCFTMFLLLFLSICFNEKWKKSLWIFGKREQSTTRKGWWMYLPTLYNIHPGCGRSEFTSFILN